MLNNADNSVLFFLEHADCARAIMVKDTIDVAGVPTRLGSRAFADALPAAQDAEVVARLRSAEWRITGKTKLHELAFGTTGINACDGTPLNCHWPELVPGGSSSGSAAAVASGVVPAALGTDTGGSIRTPAACCGVFGLKPSFGLVSRVGVAPTHSSLDCVGPIARDLPTLIDVMQAIAPRFSVSELQTPVRVGVLKVDSNPRIKTAIDTCLSKWAHGSTSVQLQPAVSSYFDAAFQAGLSVINAETWSAYGSLLADGLIGQDVAIRLRAAAATDARQVAAAREVGRHFRAEIDVLLEHCTVLALPTMPDFPPRLVDAADTSAAVSMTRLVRPFNLSGHPAITLPIAFTEFGPISLQLIAAHGNDGLLCTVAQSLVRKLKLKSSIQFFGSYDVRSKVIER